jgi:tetratricopeptide (TPR) repeat protein
MKFIRYKFLLLFILILAADAMAQVTAAHKKLLDSAQELAQKGEFDKAKTELDKLIRLNPTIGVAYFLRGECKLITADVEGALPDYDKAIKLSPPNATGLEKVYNSRGVAHQLKGDNTGAFFDFNNAIRINPNYGLPYNGRGVVLEKQGKIELALADFNKAISLDPGNPAAYVGRGNIKFQKKELDQALSDYNKSIELEPNSAAPYIIRGAVYGLRNRWEMAVADLRKGFEIDGLSPRGPLNGILSAAFADLDKFIAANPANARAFAVRGFVNLMRARNAEAERDFKRIFELDPGLNKEISELVQSVKERPN